MPIRSLSVILNSRETSRIGKIEENRDMTMRKRLSALVLSLLLVLALCACGESKVDYPRSTRRISTR